MFIHIGKCGGSNITYKLQSIHSINIKHIHCRKPKINDIKKAEHICIILRDPITRFISIFYYYYNLYLDYMDDKKIPHIETVKKTVELFDNFKTVDMLANALNSKNMTEKK